MARIDRARARARAWVWRQIVARHGQIPAARTCYGDLGKTIVIRLDASIVIAHSDKAGARGTFKGTYGHHPLLATCDNTGELLVVMLREGNAGSNTGADHVKVLDAAIAQIPAAHRRDLLVTIDGAGAGHQIVDHLTALNARHAHRVHYSVGFDLDERARRAITRLAETGWEPALDADGKPRKDAHVAELTGLLRALRRRRRPDHRPAQASWPDDLRVIVRREPIPVGMQVSLFEAHDGYRYQVTATNTHGGQLQRLEARHRVHARVEDGVRTAKATGLRRLPSKSWGINEAWCQVVALAVDLLAWLRHLTLDGDLAKAEPKPLRYKLLHTAARITRGQRHRWLNIPPTGPGPTTSPPRSAASRPCPHRPDRGATVPSTPGRRPRTRPVEPAPGATAGTARLPTSQPQDQLAVSQPHQATTSHRRKIEASHQDQQYLNSYELTGNSGGVFTVVARHLSGSLRQRPLLPLVVRSEAWCWLAQSMSVLTSLPDDVGVPNAIGSGSRSRLAPPIGVFGCVSVRRCRHP